MEKQVWVYDYEVVARDGEYTKRRKNYLVKLVVPETSVYTLDTIINFGNGNKARVVRQEVYVMDGIEVYEAVTMNKWIM